MSILLYFIMCFVGFVGVNEELRGHRTNWSLFGVFTFIFVFLACMRVGRLSDDTGDLYWYIIRFVDDEDSYFEPGYVFLTNFIKLFFGHNIYAFILIISLLLIFLVFISIKICTKFSEYGVAGCFLKNKTRYINCFFYFICPYWGCFFVWQTLRAGLAITILYCASAYAINNKMLTALMIASVSVFFHYSCIIFVIGLFAFFIFEKLSFKQYMIWFIVILFLRLLSNYTIPISSIIESVVLSNEVFTHFIEYLDPEQDGGGVFSPQDIAYHLFGMMMLKGNLSDIRYNRAVLIYYMGLSAGVIFSGSGITMRIQWLFLAMVVFALYYFVLDKRYSLRAKIQTIFCYTLIEIGMTIRQFGWYL